jgi:hypothetical protein
MGTYTAAVEKLYVAYFSRPADAAGLTYWENVVTAAKGDTTAVSKAFAASQEYKDTFAGQSEYQVINTIYKNLFGRDAEPAALTFWGQGLINKAFTIDTAVTTIANAAVGTDLTAYNNKVAAATAFSASLDTSAEMTNYSGTAANNAAKVWLSGITTDASLASAIVQTALDSTIANVINAGQTSSGKSFDLTASIDSLIGTNGGDIFNANVTATANPLGGLDVIDGGNGNDTLNIADTSATSPFSLPMGFSVSNVETINVTSNNSITMDVSGIAGVTKFVSASAAAAGATSVTAASTTDVMSTVIGTSTATIAGGKNVTVAAGTGAVSVVGSKLVSVSVTGGNVSALNSIDNGAGKTTMTSVTLNSVDTDASIRGDGVSSLTLSGATSAARTTTITNATANHALTINAAGTGYTSAGSKITSKVVDTAATSLTVNTSAKSAIDASGSTAVKSVTLTGAGSLSLTPMGATVTTIDGSAATGNLSLGSLNAAATTIKTGAGADSFTVNAAVKSVVDAGAGNDIVTLGADAVAGTTINLGAGNDSLLQGGTATVLASTTAATTVIDGGDGTDVVAAALINAANAAQFKNFEGLDLSGNSNLDIDLMTGSTVTLLALNGKAAATTGIVTNVAAGVGLTVAGDNSAGVKTEIDLKDASGSSDAFTVTFAGAAASSAPASANVKAGVVQLDGIENVTVASAGGSNTWNSITLQDTKLKTVTVTGSQKLDLSFNASGTNVSGKGGVNLIDASAATGKLNINTTNIVEDGALGLTVKGGSANDTITLAHFAMVNAGAGDDTIVASAEGDVLTGGAGADTFNLTASVAGAAGAANAVITEITDLTAGDTLVLGGATTFNATKVALDTTVTNLDAAFTLASAAANTVTWFTYGTTTYLVVNDGTAGASAGDIIVKLDGVSDLSHATFDATGHTLTL